MNQNTEMTMTTKTTLDTLTVDAVRSTYSGPDGKCCCGCKGRHTYRTATQQVGSANRGYAVTDEDVNDARVSRIVNKIKRAPVQDVEFCGDHIAVVIGKTVFIAYLLTEAEATQLKLQVN